MRRFLEAAETHDAETIRSILAASDHTLLIGSDPQEWYLGPEAVELLTVATVHSRGYRYDIRKLEAFEAGPFGWAVAETIVEFDPTGEADQLRSEPVPLRLTAVFVLEQGTWRITFWQASVPAPDDPDVVGADLSEAVTAMIKSLEGEAEISALTARLQTSTVSLVFTDIVDSTVLTGKAGDVAWSQIVTDHLAEVERTASRTGGVVVKTTGDGAMLAFGSARSAVQAAAELQEAGRDTVDGDLLQLRIGVHTGEAVKTEADYFGQTVNEAARIMAAAKPDQILVSDVTRSLVGDVAGIEFESPITVELKGIPGFRQLHPMGDGTAQKS
jgi:adenylate cyclase